MKKSFILSILVLGIVALIAMPMVMAEDTSGANWNKDLGWANDIRDYVGGHGHDYDKYEPKFEVGAEIDLIVYESEITNLFPEQVRVDTSYDFANKNGGVYVVATYNVWKRWLNR